MVTLLTDRAMLGHTPAERHPERPERLQTVLRQLERTGLDKRCRPVAPRPVTDEELLWAHDAGYLARVVQFEKDGGGLIEADTWVKPGTIAAARLGAGAAIAAVDEVMRQPDHPIALALVRPPGHHARPSDAMGFCIYGNVALAAHAAIRRHGLERVLVVDWDVHHGNGTQEMFYDDGRVGFLSIHRSPFYPGTGAADETGTGRGLGFTRNIPLPLGVSRAEFRAAFRSGLERLADKVKPQLVIVSAGFDAHSEDPVGNLGLETDDFTDLTNDVLEVARAHASGRLVSVLEGGYNPSRLAGCVEVHLRALLDSRPAAAAGPGQ